MELTCTEQNQIRDPTFVGYRDNNKSFIRLMNPVYGNIAKIIKHSEDYYHIVDVFYFGEKTIYKSTHRVNKDSNAIPEWMKQETAL